VHERANSRARWTLEGYGLDERSSTGAEIRSGGLADKTHSAEIGRLVTPTGISFFSCYRTSLPINPLRERRVVGLPRGGCERNNEYRIAMLYYQVVKGMNTVITNGSHGKTQPDDDYHRCRRQGKIRSSAPQINRRG